MTPPRGFLEPSPPISNVKVQFRHYARARGNTAAREAGLRFEEAVQSELTLRFPDTYRAEPHVMYFTGKGPRNAFPDGLMLLDDRTVIVEIKRQHMPEAWWQLRRHYQVVLEKYRPKPVQVLEVVKEFDLQMPFPEDDFLLFENDFLGKFLELPVEKFGVMLWKP